MSCWSCCRASRAPILFSFLPFAASNLELDKVIEALLFSLILYLLTLPFFGYTFPLGWGPLDAQHPNIYRIIINWKHLLWLTGASVVFAVIYSANINQDWMMWILRRIKVTERTGRKTIWNDAFQEVGGMVQVGLSDDRRVLGWLRYYSDEAEDSSLFLEEASWVKIQPDGKETEEPINGPGILITKNSGIEYVMFLNWVRRDRGTEDTA